MITYRRFMSEICHLKRFGVETGSIGKSVEGRPIPYIFAGNKRGKTVFITAGIHAREHVGVYCCLSQAYFTLNQLRCNNPYGGIYFIPCLNPDGLVLAEQPETRLWKANARGVDLNVNFDAGWGTGIQNTFTPGSENYVGSEPFSEPETRAVRDFTLLHKPGATVSYHAKGREIYWEFGQTEPGRSRDRAIAGRLNECLDYSVIGDNGTSAGGYKDWCIQALKIPSFTVELVSDRYTHPILYYGVADEDIKRNLDLPIRLLRILNEETKLC